MKLEKLLKLKGQAMFKSVGPTELAIVAVIILFLVGGKKIPEFFKGLGEAVREFKKASGDMREDIEKKVS